MNARSGWLGESATIWLAVAVLAACETNSSSPTSTQSMTPSTFRDGTANGSANGSANSSASSLLARALAISSRDLLVRAELLRAMRVSPWTEHKVELLAFLSSAEGVRTERSMRQTLGPDVFASALAHAPLLEFYLPVRAHRLEWRARDELQVALVLDNDAQVATRFYSTGDAVELALDRTTIRNHRAVLLIAPPEGKSTRLRRQVRAEGPVVQDADDGDLGLTITRRSGADSLVVDVGAQIVAAALYEPTARINAFSSLIDGDEGGGGGGGGGGGCTAVMQPEQTRWMYLRVWVYDGVGSAEVEISYAYYFVANGFEILDASATHRWDGVDYGEVLLNEGESAACGLLALSRAVHGTRADHMVVSGYETDWNDGEYLGGRDMQLADRRQFWSTQGQAQDGFFLARFDWVP